MSNLYFQSGSLTFSTPNFIQKYSVEGTLHTTIQKTRSLVITYTFTESIDNLIKV